MAVLLLSGKTQAVGLPTLQSAMQQSTWPEISVKLYLKTFKTTGYISNKITYFYLNTATFSVCKEHQQPTITIFL